MNPVLYILIRSDLDSMNAGKAVAHGAHAANAFDAYIQDSDQLDNPLYMQWKEDRGFGTTVTLHATKPELVATAILAESHDICAGTVIDPTYPYMLHAEYASLITHPEPPVMLVNNMMACVREEVTAGYVFGDKKAVQKIVAGLGLMP